MDANFWDARYAEHASVYGTEPNAFLKEQLKGRKPGTALFPAEGEGRNALYAASLGWKVKAFDQSTVARDKALARAAKAGLELDYELLSLPDFRKAPIREVDAYDLVGLFYVHMPEPLRRSFHAEMVDVLKPGGILILECFSERQLEYNSGGPKEISMLNSVEKALEDFSSLADLHISEMVVDLDEGPFHKGPASVLRVTGSKY
jgi:SAM-dependent methyltransferase